MSKVLFVVNPVSGGEDKSGLLEQIKAKAVDYDYSWELMYTSGDNDKEKVEKNIKELEPDIVAVAGGDGTINLVAKLLVDRPVKLGIVPVGSANGTAFQLGIPVNISRALDILFTGRGTKIDVLQINNKHISIHLSDLGMNARIIKRFEKEGVRGFYGYAKQFIKELKAPKEFLCTINTEKQEIKSKARMVVMANAESYGTGAVINPEGRIDDGVFEIIIIRPYPDWYIFKILVVFFTRNLHRQKYIKSISCTRARITLSPRQELQVDGESLGKTGNLEVTILPRVLNVICNN